MTISLLGLKSQVNTSYQLKTKDQIKCLSTKQKNEFTKSKQSTDIFAFSQTTNNLQKTTFGHWSVHGSSYQLQKLNSSDGLLKVTT
jgi:hypothetical protein